VGAFSAKQDYFDVDKFHELACVGAGIGGGFISTNELHVMNYQEAMKTPDKAYWRAAVDEEHQRMIKHNV
jgi:hypothetical protein